MELQTKRLILRPFTEGDAADLYEYAKDPRVGPMAGWPVHKNVEESLETIRNVFTKPYDLAFVDKKTGKVIGSGGLMDRHRDWLPGKNDEIGCVLHPDYWGQGLGVEAMEEFFRIGFEELLLDHIWSGYYDGNEKSKRLQEKLGMVPWGEPRWVDVPLMGERRLEHVNLLRRTEWEGRR